MYIKVLVETGLPHPYIVNIQVLVETGLPHLYSVYPGSEENWFTRSVFSVYPGSGGNWFTRSVYGVYPFGNPNLINIQVKTIDIKKAHNFSEFRKCCQLICFLKICGDIKIFVQVSIIVIR